MTTGVILSLSALIILAIRKHYRYKIIEQRELFINAMTELAIEKNKAGERCLELERTIRKAGKFTSLYLNNNVRETSLQGPEGKPSNDSSSSLRKTIIQSPRWG